MYKDVEDKTIHGLFREVRGTIFDLTEKINLQTQNSTQIADAIINQIAQLDKISSKMDTYINESSITHTNISNNYDNIINDLQEIKTSLDTISKINNKLEFRMYKILTIFAMIYTVIGLLFTLYQSGFFTISGLGG